MSVCKKSAIEFCISLMMLLISVWRGNIVSDHDITVTGLIMPTQTRAISWEWNNYLLSEWLVTGAGSWEIYWSWHENSHAQWPWHKHWHQSLSHRVTSETGQQSTENIYTIRRWKLMSMSVSFRLNDPSLRRQLLIFWDIHLEDPFTLSFSSQILEYTDKIQTKRRQILLNIPW